MLKDRISYDLTQTPIANLRALIKGALLKPDDLAQLKLLSVCPTVSGYTQLTLSSAVDIYSIQVVIPDILTLLLELDLKTIPATGNEMLDALELKALDQGWSLKGQLGDCEAFILNSPKLGPILAIKPSESFWGPLIEFPISEYKPTLGLSIETPIVYAEDL